MPNRKIPGIFFNENLVFIYSMTFMSFSLDILVKNLSDDKFKYLAEEFGSENLELLKHKGNHPYEHMNSFETFNDCLPENIFLVQQKKEKLVMMVKYQMNTC